MDGATRKVLESFQTCFAGVEAPRVAASCDHRLMDILVITVLTVLSGADDWTDIKTFGKLRREWLKAFLD